MAGLAALLIVIGLCVGAIYLAAKTWRWMRRWRVRIDVDYRDDIVVKIAKGLTAASYNSVIVARLKPGNADFEQSLVRAKAAAQARCDELNHHR